MRFTVLVFVLFVIVVCPMAANPTSCVAGGQNKITDDVKLVQGKITHRYHHRVGTAAGTDMGPMDPGAGGEADTNVHLNVSFNELEEEENAATVGATIADVQQYINDHASDLQAQAIGSAPLPANARGAAAAAAAGSQQQEAAAPAPAPVAVLHGQQRFYVFFVKFHKVGGTTMSESLNHIIGASSRCGLKCGMPNECGTKDIRHACTGHMSRTIFLQSIVGPLPSGKTERYTDLLPASRVMPMDERHRHLQYKQGNWLPSVFHKDDRLVMVTLLREPTERLRSKYYFQKNDVGWCTGPKCLAKRVSFSEWMATPPGHINSGQEMEARKEYVHVLGHGSVSKGKLALATQFDHVAILEHLSYSLVELARLFRVRLQDMRSPCLTLRDNSAEKEPWNAMTRAQAMSLTVQDRELYKFGRKLSMSRLLEVWNSTSKLDKEVEKLNQAHNCK